MSYAFNTENGFPVTSWYDDKTDNELERIVPVLTFLSEVHDVTKYIPKIICDNEVNYDKANLLINDIYLAENDSKEGKENIIVDNSDIIHKIENEMKDVDYGVSHVNDTENKKYPRPITSNSCKIMKLNNNNSCKNIDNRKSSMNDFKSNCNINNEESSQRNKTNNINGGNTTDENKKASKNHFRKNVQNLNINIGKSCPGIRLYKYDANLNEQNPKKIIQNEVPTVKDNANTSYNDNNTTSKIIDETNTNQTNNPTTNLNINVIKKTAGDKEKKKKNCFRKPLIKNPKMNIISSGITTNLNQLSYSYKSDKFKSDLLKKSQPKNINTKNSLTSSNKIFTSKFITPTSPISPTTNRPQTSKPIHGRQLSLKEKTKEMVNNPMLYRSPSSQIVFFNNPMTSYQSMKINHLNNQGQRPLSGFSNYPQKSSYSCNRPKSSGKIATSPIISGNVLNHNLSRPSSKTPKNTRFSKKIQNDCFVNNANIHHKRFNSNTTRHKQFISSSSNFGLTNLSKPGMGFSDNYTTTKIKKEKPKISNTTRVLAQSVGKKN